MEGGFFLRKTPLDCVLSVKNRIENAVARIFLIESNGGSTGK